MKKWTQRELRTGGVVEPSAINDELRAQQSSMTTLDREQFDKDWVEDTDLKDNAILTATVDGIYPSASYGEQSLQSGTGDVPVNSFTGITAKLDPGSWFDLSSTAAITLEGFRGGNLFVEWSGNAYVFPTFSDTVNLEFPMNPKYLNLRILVNNTLLAERRGPALHEHFRIFGSMNFPPGDLSVRLQAKMTSVGPDDPLETNGGASFDIPQVHLYSNKYLAIGRFR